MKRVYPDLESFYRRDARRVASDEVAFGSLWRILDDDVAYQVKWVEATGEVYASPLDRAFDPRVPVLGVVESRAELERILAGWEHVCGEAGSLGWVALRLAGLLPSDRAPSLAGVAQRSFS